MQIKIEDVSVNLIEDGDRICGHIASGKSFEPESLSLWHKMCSKGGTVIDVGGYSGLFSIVAAKLGCRVVCIEPMPMNAARIIENCRLNKVLVELHQAVASNDIGLANLTYNPKVSGMTSGASLIRRKGFQIPVKSITIDSLNVDPVAIKIDVERGEYLVLEGARKTIAKSKPMILVEVLDEEREKLVRQSIDGYEIVSVVDVRNWLMRPC